MALNATTLKSLMKSKIEALSDFPVTGSGPVFMDDRVLQAISEAVVEHIVGHAVVVPNTFAAATGIPVVTVGSPTTQSGATTAPGPLTGTGQVT